MKKTLLFKLFTFTLLTLLSVKVLKAQESVIYTTGFESSEGFTATNVYNNTTVLKSGPNGQQWGTYYGTPATTGAIGGTQSMHMRWYTSAVTNLGYTYTDFNLTNVTKVTFNASNTAGINVIASYSTDEGVTYTGEQTFELTTTSTLYTYNISALGAFPKVKIKFTLTFATAPTATSRLYLDNVSVYGIPASDVTAPTFTVTPGNADINVAINKAIVLTFDEAIRNIDNSEITNANVASLLTLKETNVSGINVAFSATIDPAKKVITATPTTDLKNGQVYYAAIAPVEDAANNATTMSSMTFTTISATTATISGVAITETSPYFAGDKITITWASTNVTDVKIEAWVPSENVWQELFASTPSDGSAIFTLPSDLQYSANYKLRITDIADANVTAESSTFTIVAVVNNLLALRALKAGDMVKYMGIATVTFTRTSRNQKYIQDATAAVLIDDLTTAPGFINGTYAIGDGITNIVGKIALYSGLIEFVPTQITGEPATGIEIVPEVRTLASLTAADQCKLVKIKDFAFKTPTQWDVDGKFVSSKNYDIEGSDNTLMAYRTAFFEADYIGGQVPVGPFSSVVLVGQFNAQIQITARSWSDMTLPFVLPKLVITEIMYNSPETTGDEEWIEVYNNGTSPVDMSGYFILDSDPLHIPDPMVIPSGSIIAPGAYFTIETSTFGFFPFVPGCNVLGGGTGKFNFGNTSDQVKLYHSNGKLIDSVLYTDSAPWPTGADGGGSSLTLCDPNLDNSLASSWEASLDEFTTLQSTKIYATPGTGCVLHTKVAPKLQNEITVYPNPTSDELYISNPANDLLEITILSAIGKPLKSLQSAKGIASFDLSGLPKGMYFVKMNNKTQKTTQMKKVVVN